MIVDGVAYSFSPFLDTFSNYFDAPKGTVAWISSLLAGMYLSAGECFITSWHPIRMSELKVAVSGINVTCTYPRRLSLYNKNIFIYQLTRLLVLIYNTFSTYRAFCVMWVQYLLVFVVIPVIGILMVLVLISLLVLELYYVFISPKKGRVT